ncbi:F-actin-capping protein subunit alpha [Pyronema domesticum]|uniref:F-actin-capping protein subunit alpha n=1 Tax=Pyronema omphalodes (strain CBS 100304) TaxID=1076935 RepID=U4LQP5_PYROM|nr:F-actin-capping protein subunit alpha [Pyronema domesticum]CCX31660.1 Similar to F-actin-capping protein subunit alpha; acc. no. Q9P5K9 [Pyronema omphalodes CBS 100304]
MSTDAIETVSGFILDAPPGELKDVLSDVKALIGDDDEIVQELIPAVAQYNKEQLVVVKLPGSSVLVPVSDANELEDGRFCDVESSSSFAFDHLNQKASNVQSWTLESQNADLIKSLVKATSTHVSEHYPSNPAFTVAPIENDSKVAINLTGAKFSPANYWNGRWRSMYIFDPSSNMLTGDIKVDVHYYEDGNVRLLSKNTLEIEIPGGSASEIIKAISKKEKDYQASLNEEFETMNQGAFKALRRQLPVTRQKIDWQKIGSYRLGQKVGLFPTHQAQE